MLTKLKIQLDSLKDLNNHYLGSLLHGFLIEKIPPDYANFLHTEGLRPFCQFLSFDKELNSYVWNIHTLTEESRSQILSALLTGINGKISLSHKDLCIPVISKNLTEAKSYSALSEEYFIEKKANRFIKIHFITATTFKSNGKYLISPDLTLIYNSLLTKWNQFATKISLEDPNILKDLSNYSKVIGYKLQSTKFHMEGIKIQGFKGEIMVKINGPDPLVRIANLLFAFGEYSGIGAKTAMGMGGVKIE